MGVPMTNLQPGLRPGSPGWSGISRTLERIGVPPFPWLRRLGGVKGSSYSSLLSLEEPV